MTGRSADPATAAYRDRERRVVELRERQPHARELLDVYVALLALQEPIYREALRSDWLADVAGEDARRTWRLEALPLEAHVAALRGFISAVAHATTEMLRTAGTRLSSQDDEELAALLRRGMTREPLDDLAAVSGVDVALLEFYVRAYVEPVAQALASLDEGGDLTAAATRLCPRCGWPPQATVLRDDAETKGRRLMVCALCDTWWPYTRVTCVECGEHDPKKLSVHEGGPLEHVRIEACQTCNAYLKSIDLRRDGRAVPVVDELASVELDLWAHEQGLWKVQRNLLAL